MLPKIFLDMEAKIKYNTTMKNEIAVKMSPEGLEVANTYLELGSVSEVCSRLKLDENTVSEYLGKREIVENVIHSTLVSLEEDGFIKTVELKNGEKELVKVA